MGSNEHSALYDQARMINAADPGTITTTFNTTQTATFTMTTRGPANTGMWVDWGDGSGDWIVHLGTSTDVVTNHNYSGLPGYKAIVFSGQLEQVTYLDVSGQSVFCDVQVFSSLTGLVQLSIYNNSGISGNISGISGMASLERLYASSTSISGNVSGIGGVTTLEVLQIPSTSVSGNISGIASLTALTQLSIENTAISGDIGGISALSLLSQAYMTGSSVSGNVSGISGLTALTILHLSNTAVSGNVSGFQPLTSLTQLLVNGTSVSGSVAGINALTSLAFLYVNSTSCDYATTAALPAWSSIQLQFQDCALPSSEVDNFLIDLNTAGGSNGTLNIAGTNAARTSASDAAYTALVGRGWSITVN